MNLMSLEKAKTRSTSALSAQQVSGTKRAHDISIVKKEGQGAVTVLDSHREMILGAMKT